jgi:hypothetical protein
MLEQMQKLCNLLQSVPTDVSLLFDKCDLDGLQKHYKITPPEMSLGGDLVLQIPNQVVKNNPSHTGSLNSSFNNQQILTAKALTESEKHFFVSAVLSRIACKDL